MCDSYDDAREFVFLRVFLLLLWSDTFRVWWYQAAAIAPQLFFLVAICFHNYGAARRRVTGLNLQAINLTAIGMVYAVHSMQFMLLLMSV